MFLIGLVEVLVDKYRRLILIPIVEFYGLCRETRVITGDIDFEKVSLNFK